MPNAPTVPAQYTFGDLPFDIMHFRDEFGIITSWIDCNGVGWGNLGSGGGSSGVLSGSVSTSGTSSDSVNITGVTVNSHYSITPTNSLAAADIAAGHVYVATKGAGFVVIAHGATAGMTFDILATPS